MQSKMQRIWGAHILVIITAPLSHLHQAPVLGREGTASSLRPSRRVSPDLQPQLQGKQLQLLTYVGLVNPWKPTSCIFNLLSRDTK
jgi:hypothetical protein